MTNRSDYPPRPTDWGSQNTAFAAGQEEARSHYQALPQTPRYIYTGTPKSRGGNGDNGGTNFENIHLPILLVATALAFVAAVTYFGTMQFNDVKNAISDLSRKVDGVTDNMTQRITRMEDDLKSRTASRYTRQDHELWCLKTEKLNPNWRCAGVLQNQADASPPIWDGQKEAAVGLLPRWAQQMDGAIK